MKTESYVLIIKDKTLEGDSMIFGSNLQKLNFTGIENVQFDRKNVTAKVYHYDNGKVGSLACNCNLLLETYEG